MTDRPGRYIIDGVHERPVRGVAAAFDEDAQRSTRPRPTRRRARTRAPRRAARGGRRAEPRSTRRRPRPSRRRSRGSRPEPEPEVVGAGAGRRACTTRVPRAGRLRHAGGHAERRFALGRGRRQPLQRQTSARLLAHTPDRARGAGGRPRRSHGRSRLGALSSARRDGAGEDARATRASWRSAA